MSFKTSFHIFSRSSLVFFFTLFFFTSPVSAVDIPTELASVSEKSIGTNGKTVVLIQEAHTDYNAQKTIAAILKHLVRNESLRLVLVEGGWGDVSVSRLKLFGTPESRLRTAEDFLKLGKMSGEEYLGVTSDFDLSLWGIEDAALYRANMEAFLKIRGRQTEWSEILSELEASLETLKSRVYPKPLYEFDQKRRAFEKHEITLFDYLAFLREIAQKGTGNTSLPVPFWNTPKLTILFSLMGEGGTFDAARAELEKRNLIQALSKRVAKIELSRIQILKDRKEPVEELEFLETLLRFHAKYQNKIPSAQTKNLEAYTRALREMTSDGFEVVFEELKQLEETLAKSLVSQADAAKLLEISAAFELIEKLLNLELGPAEYEKFQNANGDLNPEHWREFLSRKNIPSPQPSPLGRGKGEGEKLHLTSVYTQLSQAIPEARAFYESALKREEALIQNSIRKLSVEHTRIAALITGGFHARPISEALKRAGFSVMAVTPRFEPSEIKDHQEQYFRVLESSWFEARQNFSGQTVNVKNEGRLNLS